MDTENNILIAQFMGYKKMHPENTSYYNTDRNHELFIDDSKYHSDWNWLMKVVEKIENLKINKFAKHLYRGDVKPIEGHFWFQTCKDVVEIYASVYYWQHNNQINGLTQEFTGKNKLEATYNACVEFIKWYNLNVN